MEEIIAYLYTKGYVKESTSPGLSMFIKDNTVIYVESENNLTKLHILQSNNSVFKGKVGLLSEFKVLEKQLGLSHNYNNRSLYVNEFRTETNIYVYGGYFDDIDPAFTITDDESSIDIVLDGTKRTINTIGFVYILTAKEMKEAVKSIQPCGCSDYVFIENFKGTIVLKLPDSEQDCKFTDEINLSSDYISHEVVDTINGRRAYVCPQLVFNKVDCYANMSEATPTITIEGLYLNLEEEDEDC